MPRKKRTTRSRSKKDKDVEKKHAAEPSQPSENLDDLRGEGSNMVDALPGLNL